MQTTNFYARDFLWITIAGLASFAAKTTMNLHSETFNILMFAFAWCVWGFEFSVVVFKEHKNWTDVVLNYHLHPFANTGHLFLWMSLIVSPLYNLFNGSLTPLEGLWDAILLSLSMQPIRYFWDNVRSFDKSIIKNVHDDNKYRDHAA